MIKVRLSVGCKDFRNYPLGMIKEVVKLVQKGKTNSYFQLDFIGIGAAKSGTTWLAKMLSAHPDIFIPPEKELYYFNRYERQFKNLNYGKPLAWYAAFFKEAQNHQLKGEITPRYLADEYAAKNIYNFNPDIKILAILRHPVDRLFSLYLTFIHRGDINRIPFEKLIKISHSHDVNLDYFRNLGYLRGTTLYYTYLKRYFDLFPRENIKIAFFDDLLADNIAFLKDIQSFLNIKPFIPRTVNERINVTQNPRYSPINIALRRIQFFFRKYGLTAKTPLVKYFAPLLIRPYQFFTNNMSNPFDQKPPVDEKLRKALINYYLTDIENLEKLLGRDLSHWKK